MKWNVSDNNCIKTIESKNSKKLLFIAKKAGQAKITANYGSKKSTWLITVKKDKTSIIETSVKKNSKAKVNMIYTFDISNFENWNMERGLYKLVANTNLSTGKEYVLFEI